MNFSISEWPAENSADSPQKKTGVRLFETALYRLEFYDWKISDLLHIAPQQN